MCRKFILPFLLVMQLCLISLLTTLPLTFAQSDTVPTPVGIISIQGGNNVGQVQLLTMPDTLTRTGILAWRDAGVTGRGIRIGVLDQGFAGLQVFADANEGQVQVAPGADIATYNADPIRHGTDVLLVIHSIAPDAEYYVCRYFTFDEYRICIDWMLAADVKIVNHSAGVPALPLDGSNRWALEVDRMARTGTLWVNAAGNFAGGFVNDIFTDTNINGYHEFRGTGTIESLAIQPINQAFGRVLLSWELAEGGNANTVDLDLEIIGATGDIIAASTNTQAGNATDEAIEYVQINMGQPFGVRVRNSDGSNATIRFVLFIEFATVPTGRTGGSIIAPGDSLNSLTVGALQGTIVTVLDGPVYSEGYTWWNVRSVASNEGWSVEAADGLNTLIFLPLAPAAIPTPAVRCVLLAIRSDAFQRSSPGPEFRDSSFVPEGQNAADAQAIGTDGYVWWRLTSGLWVRSDVVSEMGDCDQLPAVPG
jgi:hypothetical protein